MSTADAKKILLENMEAEMKEETGRRIREWEATLQQQANEKSQEILSRPFSVRPQKSFPKPPSR